MTKLRPCCVVLILSTSAWAMGPVVGGGAVYTLAQSANGVSLSHLVGPTARVGFELGDRFNHEFAFQYSGAWGEGTSGAFTSQIQVLTLSGWYTFSVDFFTKQGLAVLPGFTPSLGVGLAAGTVHVTVDRLEQARFYLEFHALVGVRYTFRNGLGVRLEGVLSTYGGFVGIQPSLAVSYRF